MEGSENGTDLHGLIHVDNDDDGMSDEIKRIA
jgi:hypothetical protein